MDKVLNWVLGIALIVAILVGVGLASFHDGKLTLLPENIKGLIAVKGDLPWLEKAKDADEDIVSQVVDRATPTHEPSNAELEVELDPTQTAGLYLPEFTLKGFADMEPDAVEAAGLDTEAVGPKVVATIELYDPAADPEVMAMREETERLNAEATRISQATPQPTAIAQPTATPRPTATPQPTPNIQATAQAQAAREVEMAQAALEQAKQEAAKAVARAQTQAELDAAREASDRAWREWIEAQDNYPEMADNGASRVGTQGTLGGMVDGKVQIYLDDTYRDGEDLILVPYDARPYWDRSKRVGVVVYWGSDLQLIPCESGWTCLMLETDLRVDLERQ